MASQLAPLLPSPCTAPRPGGGCSSPRTRGRGRSLPGPRERPIPPGWKELQAQGRAEPSHPPLRLGAPTCPPASAPSPHATGATQPRALAPCRPPRSFPRLGANATPPQPRPSSGLRRPGPEHPCIPQQRQPGQQSCGSFGDTHTRPLRTCQTSPQLGDTDLGGLLRTETAAVERHFRSWSFSQARSGGAERGPVSPSGGA